jgi:hypothetical protein
VANELSYARQTEKHQIPPDLPVTPPSRGQIDQRVKVSLPQPVKDRQHFLQVGTARLRFVQNEFIE